jgi:hypothetical protein
VSKNINGGNGTMQVDLVPGGPNGVDDTRTWSQVITPMSHMLISMTRGRKSAIVMDGITTTPAEAQKWYTTDNGSVVSRGQIINGADFSWFFTSFNFFALTFYGLMAGTPVGNALDWLPGSLSTLLSQGLVGSVNPVQMARLWYSKVMAGTNGILGKTYVPYKNDGRVLFNSAMTAQWENYPGATIPYSDYFMVAEESWDDKFRNILAFPWYEFFITTAPKTAYLGAASFDGYTDQGTQFTMQSAPLAPAAGPLLVARVNPTPTLKPPGSGMGSPGPLDVTRWNALKLFDFTQEVFGFFEASISFSSDDARNFYQLNPTGFKTLFANNSNNLPIPFLFSSAADAASAQRYGFRPQIGTTRWIYDPTGKAGESGNPIQMVVNTLLAALVSWYHPAPLMARATVTIPLSPDILVGCRFRFIPYKDGVTWDFYIEGFQHVFVFGGDSSTTLTLSRGLPTAVYQDAGGLLQAVFLGNAMRQTGTYVSGLPAGSGPPLQYITPQNAADVNQRLTNIPNTPQGK